MLRSGEGWNSEQKTVLAAESERHNRDRVTAGARACFMIAGIAFFACGMGLLVNHFLTGILMVLGTAAIGLVYLAFGVYRLATGHLANAATDEILTDGSANGRHVTPR
jgi:hypothetical protein